MRFRTWPLKDWELGMSIALGKKDKYISISAFKRYYTFGIGKAS
jgi:hypothetical protein